MNDVVKGYGLILLSFLLFFLEFYLLFVYPFGLDLQDTSFALSPMYWALTIPVFIATAGILFIVFWLGYNFLAIKAPESEDIEEMIKNLQE